MSIIKIEIKLAKIRQAVDAFRQNRKKALEEFTDELKSAVSLSLNDLLNAEIDLFLGSPEQFDNKRNGYHPERIYTLRGIGGVKIRTPKDRKARFESNIVPAHERIDPRLRADIAVLQLAGLSTRTLSMVSKRLLGVEVSKDTISSSLGLIHEEAQKWLTRPIEEKYWALYVDGTNFNVQRRGSTEKEPSLVVLGINQEGYRSILAIEPGSKDNVDSWRAVFKSLKERGLNGANVTLGIMDGLPGLEKLFKEQFPKAKTQRCWVHAKGNVIAKCPARLREPFSRLIDSVMYAKSEKEARKAFLGLKKVMGSDASRAIKCLEKNLESLLTFFSFPAKYWVALRTTNAIETINRQFKRRTRGMDTIGEATLESVLAFIALKIEIGWRKCRIDSGHFNRKRKGENTIETTIEEIGLLN